MHGFMNVNDAAITFEVHTETHVIVTARYPLFVTEFKRNWNPSIGLVKLPVILFSNSRHKDQFIDLILMGPCIVV